MSTSLFKNVTMQNKIFETSYNSKFSFQSNLNDLSKYSFFKLKFLSRTRFNFKNDFSFRQKHLPNIFNKKEHLFAIKEPDQPKMSWFFIEEFISKVDLDSDEWRDLEEKIIIFKEKQWEIKEALQKIGIPFNTIDFTYPITKREIQINFEDNLWFWKLLLKEIKMELFDFSQDINKSEEETEKASNSDLELFFSDKIPVESELPHFEKLKKIINEIEIATKNDICEGDLIIKDVLLKNKFHFSESLLWKLLFTFLFIEEEIVQILLEYLLLSEFGLLTFTSSFELF